MKYYLAIFSFLISLPSFAQENYSSLTQKALEKMWKSTDEKDSRAALKMYKNAFKIYPDSIDIIGLYKASVIASELKDYDTAFKYLIPLAAIKINKSGDVGWNYIVGAYSESEYKNLLTDSRWEKLKEKALKDKSQFYLELQKNQNEFYRVSENNLSKIKDVNILYNELKRFNNYISKENRDYSISLKINDTAKTSFLIHLPKNYNPKKQYSLLFFLHGAVKNNALNDFQTTGANLGDWNRYYTKYADEEDVILVFPKGSREFNWMSPDDGFFMIPKIVDLIKKSINVNDNKVFISGHSNGATGSFSYLMKQPTKFAGFYGFNTYPKVFTGGTFVENIKNRSFINFSTDKDYYYPPNANDDFTLLMNKIKATYKEYRYNGFPHWFPEFNESEPAYKILFNDISNRKRNPFPKEISWEFDDDNYGNIDWISDMKLDTLTSNRNTQKELNFKIEKWLEYDKNDSLITKKVDKYAFDFPRKSGKITAKYENNIFQIETNSIKSLTIEISPEMVVLKNKIKVYINGKLYFDKKLKYNKEFILRNFEKNLDREQIWINEIELML